MNTAEWKKNRMDRQLTVLILDDEEVVCARLKPVLEKAGYRVEAFTDSRQAKARLEQHPFDIVVTDLKMANIDGLELSRFAKQRWPQVKVIIISGFATVDVTRLALQEGVCDVIAKPFRIAQIKELIDGLAAKIEQADEA
jgi:DNA-binding NtrC family response regulator